MKRKRLFKMKSFRYIPYLVGFFMLVIGDNANCSDFVQMEKMRSGPIPIVNQAPIQLLFLQAVPDSAETLPKDRGIIRFNTTTTNTLLAEKSGRYTGVVDMEMIRSSIDFQFGIHPRLELGLSLPFVFSYSGFMDNIIFDVEDFSGNLREIREQEEPHNYSYFVKKDGVPFIGGEKRTSGMGDLVLRLKGKILEEKECMPCVSTRLSFKFPTGIEQRALSSGKPDFGFGLLLQKDIKKLTAYLNADVIFPGDAFNRYGVSVSEFYTLMAGVERRFTPRFSGIVQVNYTTRPFKDTGLMMLERRMYDLLLGVTYCTEGGFIFQGGGIEDIFYSSDAGADITFFLNIGKFF